MFHPTTASFNESFDIPDIVQALRDVRLTHWSSDTGDISHQRFLQESRCRRWWMA